MSIFGSIMSAITGAAKTVASAVTGTASAAPAPSAAPAGAPPMSQVDVEAVLTKLASENKEKLDWRKSIVDLMKLLKLDSSLTARKALAAELKYTGDTNELGFDEHLAAQAGDEQARRERRQGAGRSQGLRFGLKRRGLRQLCWRRPCSFCEHDVKRRCR